MALVDIIRKLSQHKVLLAVAFAVAVFAAILSSYQVSVSPPGLHKRALTVAAASSQILVDSKDSALVNGTDLGTFETQSTRAKIFGQYLASLQARQEIADRADVPARSIATAGPFSAGQTAFESQTPESRADELLQEGAQNRIVFSAQEATPIISVAVQSADADTAVALANASFATLQEYLKHLSTDGEPVRNSITVRELGSPEGGTLGGGNDKILMVLAFLVVFALGCAAILVVPAFVRRWRDLDDTEYASVAPLAPHGQPQTASPAYRAAVYDHAPQAPLAGDPREPVSHHAAPR